MRTVILMMCMTFLFSGNALGSGYSSAELLEDCHAYLVETPRKDADELIKATRVFGFISGFVYGHNYACSSGEGLSEQCRFCLPEGVSIRQIVQLIIQGQDNQAESTIKDAASVLAETFTEFFPCR